MPSRPGTVAGADRDVDRGPTGRRSRRRGGRQAGGQGDLRDELQTPIAGRRSASAKRTSAGCRSGIEDPRVEGGSVPRGRPVRPSDSPGFVSGCSVHLVRVLRDGLTRAPRLCSAQGSGRRHGRILRNEKTQLPPPPCPAGSSQMREHAGHEVGRSRRDSARDVTPVSTVAGAGGAALAYTPVTRPEPVRPPSSPPESRHLFPATTRHPARRTSPGRP